MLALERVGVGYRLGRQKVAGRVFREKWNGDGPMEETWEGPAQELLMLEGRCGGVTPFLGERS